MAANATLRKTIREYLATGLRAKFNASTEVKQVYGFKRGKLDEGAPAIIVQSGPIHRESRGSGGTRLYRSVMTLPIMVYVPEANAETGWTEALVEDRVDLIEAGIAEYVADNRGPGSNYDDPSVPWNNLVHVEQPTLIADGQRIGENTYVLEIITLLAEVDD